MVFQRPLGFAVTPKTRQAGAAPWHLIRPQIVVGIVLILATIIGVTRLLLGLGEPIGTFVNLAWVVFDLLILSVLVPAACFQGSNPKETTP
ncbi:hypothetical protein CLE01_30570 [Cryobacterium levicorallinum]|uniref:Cellulose synthase (UDP-forming) n=1 Tax=Cryobacterium levicorallinum TaxID=995038 RepID=A0ABY1E9W4_9MICO|nr:hypothetical protein CLE01_30570 [Cryobacterium levicorallinum]SFH24304.1 cellulose synthase (UDP-forming) [Cryobacterium levicorallinum]